MVVNYIIPATVCSAFAIVFSRAGNDFYDSFTSRGVTYTHSFITIHYFILFYFFHNANTFRLC